MRWRRSWPLRDLDPVVAVEGLEGLTAKARRREVEMLAGSIIRIKLPWPML